MNDLRFAFRQLLKNPGFTAVVVLTLALGIGVNTTLFSALNKLLFRVVPFTEADRLVRIYRVWQRDDRSPHAVANTLDYQAQNQVFDRMAAFFWSSVILAAPGEPAERVPGLAVTGEFFDVFGVPAELGRTLRPSDDQPGSERALVISHGLWQRRFGGDTNILGRTIRVDGRPATVVGVMPAVFELRRLWGPIEAWTAAAFGAEEKRDRSHRYVAAIARLKPGVPLRQAQADLGAIAGRLAQQYPKENEGDGVRVMSLADSSADPMIWSVCYFLLATAGSVLLIACVNVANLHLARNTARQREMAIRSALGAGRLRVIRQLLTESLLLAALGGGLGLLLALWGNQLLGARITLGDLAGIRIPMDRAVLAYTAGVSVLTGLLFGLMPAWQAARPDLSCALKEGGRGASEGRAHHRWRSLLVVAEVALALVLLAGAGLFLRALGSFLQLDPGFRTERLLTFQLGLPEAKYPNAEQRVAFYRQAFERLAALPGVQGVGAVTSLPLLGTGPYGSFSLEGRPQPASGQLPVANWDMVNPRFFSTLGLAVKQGRILTEADHENAPPVAVINETMARRFWPGESPVGRRISRGDPVLNDWVEIVGVVSDIRYPADYARSETRPQVYESLWQRPRGATAVILRTTPNPESVAEPVRRAVAGIDSDLPVSDLVTFENAVERELANLQLSAHLLGGFAVLGLLLASIGIYGVVSYSVAQRTNELGIRLALGAQPADVLRLVVRQNMKLVLAGTAVGLLGALLLSLAIRRLLYGISATDPTTFTLVLTVLVGAALLACYVPARRAAKVDPMEALRCE